MTASFARLTIDRLRYPNTTDQGVTVTDYDAAPAEAPIEGCWYEPLVSDEVTDARTAFKTGYAVVAPLDADLTALDRVRINGEIHEVDGPPRPVFSPTGLLDHLQFVTKLWEG